MPEVPGSFRPNLASLVDPEAPTRTRVSAVLAVDCAAERIAVIWKSIDGRQWLDVVGVAGLCLYEAETGIICRDVALVMSKCCQSTDREIN